MADFDSYVGFWVKDEPYIFYHGDTYEESGREYLTKTKELVKLYGDRKCSWAANYFSWSGFISKAARLVYSPDIRWNGRTFYDGLPTGQNKPTEQNKPLEIMEPISPEKRSFLPKALEIYNGVEFDMSSLICSQLSNENATKDWVDILDVMKRCKIKPCDGDPCTKIGYKIAKSLIKIASLRIFADPEQSIMELPVNSLDAYNPDRKIGKFGMGFFSILYWLFGHPKRTLTLESFTKDSEGKFCSYRVVLKENSLGALTFALTTFPYSEITTTGLKLVLDASSDEFSTYNVEKFQSQIHKLAYMSGASLYLSNIQNFKHAQKNIANDGTNPIFCMINYSKIVIEDFATGIPLEVLFGSLFVPSISTKTISGSLGSTARFVNSSGINKLEFHRRSRLAILIGGIAVVYLNCSDSDRAPEEYDYLIDLPSTTRLPVSRDDIIFTPETSSIFRESVAMVFRDASEKIQDVSIFQEGLQKYAEFTSNAENKLLVKRVMNDHFERYKYNLVPSGFKKLYESLRKEIKDSNFVTSSLYDVSAVEKWLGENIKSQEDIWYGMKVVLVDDLGDENVSDGGLVNYLFVSRKYISRMGEEWVKNITSSYFKTKLYPVTSSYGEKEYAKYNKLRLREVINFVEEHQGQDPSPLFRETYERNVGKYVSKANRDDVKPSDVVSDPNTLKFIFAVLSKYESLDVYFNLESDSYNFHYFQWNIYILYLCLPPSDFLTVLNEILKKFSSFKGSQTYGASKNKLYIKHIDNITDFSDSALPDEKVNEYVLQHILCTIRAVSEESETGLRFTNDNSPNGLYASLEKYPAGKAFYREVAKQSTNFVEFTTVLVGAGKCFMRGETGSFLENIEGIHSLVSHFIQEIRSRKYTISFVVDTYETFKNLGVEKTRFTKVSYIRDKQIAAEWVKNMSNVSSIESIQEFPKPQGDTLTLSSLVKTLFKNDMPEKDLPGFFRKVSQTSSTSTPLQIIEIATNEGTTKPFIEATMTELVQNSIDAIREFNPVNKTIEINLNKSSDEKSLILTIRDYIGMSSTAFVYVGIPFLSTKTPSELVTGEMGSGFFNSYRESSSVVINSMRENVKRISYDVPVRNNADRVVDISKTISITKDDTLSPKMKIVEPPKTREYYSSLNVGQLKMILKDRGLIVSGRKEDLISRLLKDDKGGEDAPKVKKGFVRASKVDETQGYTDIIVTIPVKAKFDYVDIVSRAEYTAKSVLALSILPGGNITFNGKKIDIPKITAGKVGYFELYYTDPDRSSIHESYMLTKGIPFAPLAPFFRDILAQRVLDIIDRNFIINITHGGYTPVQTRTRITLAPEVTNDFRQIAMYAAYLTMVREVGAGRLLYALPHLLSTASASQLLFQTAWMNHRDDLKIYDESTFLLYVKFLDQPTLAHVINECIAVMGERPYNVAFDDIQKVLGRLITVKDDILKTNLWNIVEKWLRPKNADSKLVKTPKGKTPDQKDIPEVYFEKIIKRFIDTFWSIAKSSQISGFEGRPPTTKVVFSYKERSKKGFYDPSTKSITINTYLWEVEIKKDLETIFKNGANVDQIETVLKKNKIWTDFFGYQFPSSTIVHELEHARRGQSHTGNALAGGGAHENITVSLFPGDTAQTRSFDQSANAVYQKVLEGGVYEKFFGSFKDIHFS